VYSYLVVSILLALGVGLMMSMMTLFLQWAIAVVKYPAEQIFFDGNVLYGILMFILYTTEQQENSTFSIKYFILSNI